MPVGAGLSDHKLTPGEHYAPGMTAVELEMVIAAQSEHEEDAKKVGRVRRGLHR
jgi:hypothetical protein